MTRSHLPNFTRSHLPTVDTHTGVHLATLLPLDKQRNASGHRRAIRIASALTSQPSGIAPRLRELMRDYAATGLPPAYLTQYEHHEFEENDE